VPAVNGTASILHSALKYGSFVKRIVVLSSAAAILRIPNTPKIFTEDDWNEQSIQLVEKQGKAAGSVVIYMAGKTLAEKTAWDFWAQNKRKVHWALTVLNPSYV